MDTVHGDRRTRLEKWQALAQVAEQLLVRLDLAEGVLGYLDERGRYVLNTQCRIAADAGISAPVLCRLLATLDEAGYLHRRIERVRLDELDQNGLHLVRTRVLVRFTVQFWADLGLRLTWERAQRAAAKKRQAALRQIAQRQASEMEREGLSSMRRARSRANWQAAQQRSAVQPGLHLVSQSDRTALIVAIAQERGIPAREAAAVAEQLLQAELTRRHRA